MQDMPEMHGMDHQQPATFIDEILHHDTAGTSAQPNSTAEPMIMRVRGKWMFMFHGVAFLSALQQSGPRGYDKVFSTNWLMPMAQRQIGQSEFTLRTMLSLEPATVTNRFYPLLFQQGETAFGKPINDGQHPHDFIMELEDGYETVVGERGATLSGGQRQRIAIARTFIRNAPILILDEPMTGLDVESESTVREALRRLMAGRTSILITHDLPAAAEADLILVLADGHIVEQGTHQELLTHNRQYRELWEFRNSQAGIPAGPMGIKTIQ